MGKRLHGAVALVTGGGRGIGRAIAFALANEGAKVVVVARTESEITRTAGEIRQIGGESLSIPCDVSREWEVNLSIKKILEQFGRLDILINNAGVCILGPISEFTEREWDILMDINLKGVFYFSRAVWNIMIQQGGGVIVNISSRSGKRGRAEWSAYCASKFGVIGLTESLAMEGRPHGIRVNAICPEGTDTSMQASINSDGCEKRGQLDLIRPADVARVAVFLASDDARAVTGSAIDVLKGLNTEY